LWNRAPTVLRAFVEDNGVGVGARLDKPVRMFASAPSIRNQLSERYQ
jgi:hypothetical protein